VQVYVNFITACGCSRMEVAVPDWKAPPSIKMPLQFPPKIMDWVNTPTDSVLETQVMRERKFQLNSEEVMKDGQMKIFIYREVE